MAVQGVGNVGSHLCEYLADAGAVLVVADIDDTKTALMAERYGAGVVSLDEIMEVDADVLAPCALGAILNKTSIPKHNSKTLETNITGFYIAGSMTVGNNANRIFIYNGRLHGEKIVSNIAKLKK